MHPKESQAQELSLELRLRMDQIEDGHRPERLPLVEEEYTREYLRIEAEQSITTDSACSGVKHWISLLAIPALHSLDYLLSQLGFSCSRHAANHIG